VTTLIFGATAGVGRALCRALAAAGHDLTLISRDSRDLMAESAHCSLTYGVRAEWIEADASNPIAVETALARYLQSGERRFQNLLFPVGGTGEDDAALGSAASVAGILHVNLTAIMVTVGALLPHMAASGERNIIGFGSIAAIRGRRSNVAYSAAKRGLESYFESLRHSLAHSGIRVKFYRLGYVATQQSFGKKLLLPASKPDAIARRIMADWNRDVGFVSLPRYWSAVGFALRSLPWIIYRRLSY
jgi:short-subunit dehydrogenase